MDYIAQLMEDLDPKFPLIDAAQKNLLNVVKELVNQGVDINSTNDFKRTALMQACVQGHEDVVKWLLQNGANELLTAKNDETALDFALYNGHVKIAQILINHNPEVLQGKLGQNALRIARDSKNVELIELIEIAQKTPEVMKSAFDKFKALDKAAAIHKPQQKQVQPKPPKK